MNMHDQEARMLQSIGSQFDQMTLTHVHIWNNVTVIYVYCNINVGELNPNQYPSIEREPPLPAKKMHVYSIYML